MSRLLSQFSECKLGFGSASISGEGKGYGFGPISENESIKLLNSAKENGIKLFDTAPIYGFGLAEKRIGKAFRSCREDVFLASKSGVSWHDNGRVNMSNDPKIARKMIEQSLRDLQTDYIDLYMVHWPDHKFDIRQTLEELAKAKLEGKIKHIGLCNTNIEEIELASEVDEIEVVQSEFNFFQSQIIDELFSYLNKNNISFMSWGTLDKGILTGRVHKDRKFEKDDCRSNAPWWKAMDKDSRYQTMEKIKPLLEKNNFSGLDLALNYNLSHDIVDIALCGARSIDQLMSLLESYKKNMPKDLLEELKSMRQEKY